MAGYNQPTLLGTMVSAVMPGLDNKRERPLQE